MLIWKRMKISWIDKVTNEEVLGSRVNEDKGNFDGLTMFSDTTDFCINLLNAE